MSEPTNPVIAELCRAGSVESQHRGAWVLADTSGVVIDGRGRPDQQVFARSSTKSIQALPLIESGAADALGVSDDEIAVAVASHNGEPAHVQAAASLLARAGLAEADLQCGPQRPAGTGDDAPAARITNNCSGKHAGFLATAVHLGDDPARYLHPDSKVQRLVHDAMLQMTGARPSDVSIAIDGCSAPTFRLPLRALATGLARMTNPDGLSAGRAAACRRITAAAATHPELVGGTSTDRFDTDLMQATRGRLFAKSGAEGVQTVGIVGAGLGLAVKVDDGSRRAIAPLVLGILQRLGHLDDAEADALAGWLDPVRRNFDGIDIGRAIVPDEVLPA